MEALVTIVHIVVCFILIIAVLLQSGKAADLAGAFGGAGSQSVFGPRGGQTLLSKATTISAVLFMITSFALWLMKGKEAGSVMEGTQAPAEQVETTDPKKPPATTEDKAAVTDAKTPAEKEQTAKKPGEKKAANPEKKETPPDKK